MHTGAGSKRNGFPSCSGGPLAVPDLARDCMRTRESGNDGCCSVFIQEPSRRLPRRLFGTQLCRAQATPLNVSSTAISHFAATIPERTRDSVAFAPAIQFKSAYCALRDLIAPPAFRTLSKRHRNSTGNLAPIPIPPHPFPQARIWRFHHKMRSYSSRAQSRRSHGETALVRTLNLENPELFPVSANST